VLRSMICRSGSRTSGRAAALRSSPWREVRATGHVHDLQRTAGNQAMTRWLRSQFERPSLSVGRAGDKCERRADSVTDKVMRMPDAQGPVTQRAPLKIQRLCPECEEEEAFQKKDAPGSRLEVPLGMQAQVNVLPNDGQPLPASVRAFFEPRFGSRSRTSNGPGRAGRRPPRRNWGPRPRMSIGIARRSLGGVL
jgi:hypothetical protein